MAGGRPTDYKPEFCQIAIEFLDQGKSKIQLCRHLRIAKSTLFEWEQKYPEFSTAINKGISYSESVWMDWGQDNLTNKDFNSRLYELNMMNRFSWMRKNEGKHEVKVSQEDAIKDLE